MQTKGENAVLVDERSKAMTELEQLKARERGLGKDLELAIARVRVLESELAETCVLADKLKGEAAKAKDEFKARIRKIEGTLQAERGRLSRVERDYLKEEGKIRRLLDAVKVAHTAASRQLTESGAAWLKEREEILFKGETVKVKLAALQRERSRFGMQPALGVSCAEGSTRDFDVSGSRVVHDLEAAKSALE